MRCFESLVRINEISRRRKVQDLSYGKGVSTELKYWASHVVNRKFDA